MTRKIIIMIGLVSLFFSCASSEKINVDEEYFNNKSMEEMAKSGHFYSRPGEGTITIIGVSNGMIKRESEIESAQKDAARKIALFYGANGSIESFLTSGSRGFFDYDNQTNIRLEYDTDYEKYISKLDFDPETDVYKTQRGVFVRFTYNTPLGYIHYVPVVDSSGRPSWTNSSNLPRIDGYITAVGLSRNQSYLRDTIIKSTDAAVFGLFDQISSNVAVSTRIDPSGRTIDTTHSISEGKISGFYILEFWIEPKTENVYTLAIAREVK